MKGSSRNPSSSASNIFGISIESSRREKVSPSVFAALNEFAGRNNGEGIRVN